MNVGPFKIVPLGSYTPMETLFPLLLAALGVFNRYGLQQVRYMNVLINVSPLKIVRLGSYTSMETLFPLLLAALGVFNRYGIQHVRYINVLIFLTESPTSKISLVV
jgi:hypothetical protein